MTKYIGIKPYTYWRYPFKTLWNWAKSIPKSIKWVLQRGWRGYAYPDTWSIDYYLSKLIPPMVRDLRDREFFWSCSMQEFIGNDEDQFILWQNILTDIADGFEAGLRLREQPWLTEYKGSLSFPQKEDGSWDTENDEFHLWLVKHKEEHDTVMAELNLKKEDGLSLFIEFYDDLWD